MKDFGKYKVSKIEDYEPGSNNEVLKNYLGLISKSKIEIIET